MSSETPDYKDTLNLPKTSFPMRAGLPKREPAWLERWEQIGIYDRLRDKAKAGPHRAPFTLHDGPPYANGNLHIGHALNKILKDMVVRSQQMMGRDARYIPGWDCHGLPIEWKIEEQYRAKGKNKDEVPVIDFRQECRRFAEGWVDVQRSEFKRLGVAGTWEKPYLTMDYHAERVIAEEFLKFLMNGTLYQGSKPVMWSPVEKTALAEAEIEYHDHKSFTVWVRFKVSMHGRQTTLPEVIPADVSGHLSSEEKDKNLHDDSELRSAWIVIWTTTPWTIPSNKAVAFNPAISYGLYRVSETQEESWTTVGDLYVFADTLAEDALIKSRVTAFERVRGVSTEELACLNLAHPFAGLDGADGYWDYDVPMIDGDHVTEEAGTGFVHTAPSHGADDFDAFVKRGWMDRMTHNIGEESEFLPHVPFFDGLRVFDAKGKEGKANSAVIAKLVEAGGLIARGTVKHSYPHSWRSKAPIVFRNTPQWFAAIDRPVGDGQDEYGTTIRERALTSIDKLVTWTPPSGRNRLYSMIEARPDWVLSRQRAWGVPMACFTKVGALPTDPDFLLRDPAVNARVVEAFEAEGADCWYAEGAKDRFLGADHDPAAYEQVFDILDVWFDSGSTHAFVLRDREDGSEDGIADLYLEGTDQHRGWFHSSMLQACGTMGRAPYRGVLTHGFTLDAKGIKMSKSIGNTIVPEKVVQQYGADILRLWVAQSDYTADQRIGDEILKGVADSYRRLRNTLRFMLGSLGAYSDDITVARDDMPELERTILHMVEHLDRQVKAGYAAYDFQGVIQKIFHFATIDLSAFYFDVRKDALYCDADDSLERRAALTVLDILFHRLTTWLAPILVFTCEEVWLERFPGDDSSVHLRDMPDTPESWHDPVMIEHAQKLRAVRRVVTGALELERQAKTIGSSLEAGPTVYLTPDLAKLIDPVQLATWCITSGLTVTTDPIPEGAFQLADVPHVGVVFAPAEGVKCQRCWKILPDVGSHAHPDVCARCDAALGD